VPGVARGLSWLRETRSSRWSEGLYQSLIGRAAAHLPEELRRCWRFYSALPNLGIDVFPDQMDFFQVLPAGPGKCIIRGTVFGLPGAARELRAARYLSNRINTSVNNEDRWLCERVQRGLASSSYQPGPCPGSRVACSNSTTCCGRGYRNFDSRPRPCISAQVDPGGLRLRVGEQALDALSGGFLRPGQRRNACREPAAKPVDRGRIAPPAAIS